MLRIQLQIGKLDHIFYLMNQAMALDVETQFFDLGRGLRHIVTVTQMVFVGILTVIACCRVLCCCTTVLVSLCQLKRCCGVSLVVMPRKSLFIMGSHAQEKKRHGWLLPACSVGSKES